MHIYTSLIRPILFKINPDYVHEYIIQIGSFLGKYSLTRKILRNLFVYDNPALNQQIFGIDFCNPVGNAGGFDKNAMLIQTLPSCGFGYVEVGSITAKPYAGNKRPWNVRLPKDGSLIVNYGLKNLGADKLFEVISNSQRTTPVIVNIAKTNDAEIKGDSSIADYIYSFKKLYPVADILNINISCPNTGDGVLFCEDLFLLEKLLESISELNSVKPILLKIKPDISDEKLYAICDLVEKYAFIKGFIISNLSRQRNLLHNTNIEDISNFQGGISGKPIFELSNHMIAKVYKYTCGKYIIIGLGGIFTAEDAYKKIRLGASLVELATGLIYGGPSVIKEINSGLVRLLVQDGFRNISEAIGVDSK